MLNATIRRQYSQTVSTFNKTFSISITELSVLICCYYFTFSASNSQKHLCKFIIIFSTIKILRCKITPFYIK